MQSDGVQRSVPVTRWSSPEKLTSIPETALSMIESFVADFLPELAAHGIGVSKTRMCWYNDSFDNHFVVDRVPSKRNLIVATGGSGHSFMFLPNVGKWVADIIEGKEDDDG